jgi:hypothetical protein
MAEKENDLIGFAHRVIGFRMNVIKACKELNIDVPSDKQISEYINEYGLHFKDFMADYTEHEGMFRCLQSPLEKFKKMVSEITFSTKPTDEEIVTFFNTHGDNVALFCEQRTIKEMSPIERKTYLKTIEKLSEEKLVKLWNAFIEESAHYGEDSYIYDITSHKELAFLAGRMEYEQMHRVSEMMKNGTRFIQWLNLNDGSICEKSDIKHTITAYWSEIFERIMLYPSAYNFGVEVFCNGDASTYFDDVFFPVIAKEIGYAIDGDKGTIKKIEK